MFILKRGAMFGLDARIALSIFGALSVISGAALYSAIQAAKAESYHQYFVETTKASEQYYLDNGKPLPQRNSQTLYTGDLITNREGLSTWKGPYMQAEVHLADANKNNITKLISNDALQSTSLLQRNNWTTNTSWPECASVGDANCAEYTGINFYHASSSNSGFTNMQNMFDLLDKLVDNSDGELKGKFRMVKVSANNHYLYYQGILRKRKI
jgi:type II secretory pathway pseudopilin PulG